MADLVFTRNCRPIRTLDDWQSMASTEGKWAAGFSAMELARLWLAGTGPAVVCDVLRPVLEEITITRAVAEAQVAFDDYTGGVRNHDVLAFGHAKCGQVVIGVEGKVNESLDATVNGKYMAAERIKNKKNNTNLDRRMDGLLDALMGRRVAQDPRIGGLRYQLFFAIAGTVAAATPATGAAAVVVHLIDTDLANHKKFTATGEAVQAFADAAGAPGELPVIGPLHLRQAIKQAGTDLPIWLAVLETPAAPWSTADAAAS